MSKYVGACLNIQENNGHDQKLRHTVCLDYSLIINISYTAGISQDKMAKSDFHGQYCVNYMIPTVLSNRWRSGEARSYPWKGRPKKGIIDIYDFY